MLTFVRRASVRVTAPRVVAVLSPAAVLSSQSRHIFTCTRLTRTADSGSATASSSGPSSSSPITGAAVPPNVQKQAAAATASSEPVTAAGGAPGSATPNANGNDSALDVAMRVNKLKRAHQQSSGNKKAIEGEAWVSLNSLTEEQINSAEGKAVALLLNSWAYFAKFWEKGKDGP